MEFYYLPYFTVSFTDFGRDFFRVSPELVFGRCKLDAAQGLPGFALEEAGPQVRGNHLHDRRRRFQVWPQTAFERRQQRAISKGKVIVRMG